MSSVLVKLYDKTETFKETLSGKYLSTLPRFIEQEQNGHTNLNFTYNVSYSDTTFSHYDIVKVISKSTGNVLYRGVIIGLRRIVTGLEEKIEVSAYGLQALVKKTLYYNGSSYTFTKNADPKDIIEEILTNVNSQFGFTPFSRSDSTIIHWGANINIDFDYTDSRTAIKKVLELTNYTFRIAGDGTVYFRPKQLGRGYTFDGSNDYIAVPNESTFDYTSEFTLAFRIKTSASGSLMALITKYSVGQGWELLLTATGTLRMITRGSSTIDFISSTVINDGERHDVVVTCTNTYTNIYIDSLPVETQSGTWTATTNNVAVSVGLRSGLSYFDGQLHDIRIIGREVTTSEVEDIKNMNYYGDHDVWYLCDEGSGTTAKDISGNGNNGTLTNITASTFHSTHSKWICGHLLTFKSHVSAIEIEEKSDELYNDYHVEYTGGSVQTGSDSSSQTSYGQLTRYISDGGIQDSATATERINAELERYKDPIDKVKVIVNLNYDIETLVVGDVVCVQNISYDIDGKMIVKVEFRTDEAVIYLEGYDSIENSLQRIL